MMARDSDPDRRSCLGVRGFKLNGRYRLGHISQSVVFFVIITYTSTRKSPDVIMYKGEKKGKYIVRFDFY